jgi:predicted acylesterase/phospholipase RssA
MYVVRAGRLEVVDEAAGAVIRELGRGDALGELSLLTAEPRSASARATRTTDLLAIDRTHFDDLLRATPALSLVLNRTLGEQLRATRAPASTRRPRPTTVALVAIDDRVPSAELARRLCAALRRHLVPALLDGHEVAAPAPGAEPITAYGPALDRAEADHDLVLLDGGSLVAAGPWTEFCLQQADRILAVSAAGRLEDSLRDRSELHGCDLVGYDASPRSGALAEAAALLEPIESHLVREAQRDADVARIARRLSGHSVGIVLSGGGARAFSHVGVLGELAAAGVTIDRVVGVSMGAFVGALFAMGLDADEIDARCFEEWVQRHPLSDYTVPRFALIRGERVRAMLRRTFEQVAIEQLPLSFMCGCGELRSGRLVVSRFGPLWEAIGFSMCLPIIAPPQVRGRQLLIDGSLVDNLPVRVMSDLGEGPIIAVDVKGSFEHPADSSRAERTPGFAETLTRVLLLGSENTSDTARRYADLIIKPRTEGIGLLEFHQLDAAREAGRAAVHEALSHTSASLFGLR